MTKLIFGIIILNWNGSNDTIHALKTLDNQIYQQFFIILIDNGSTDDSVTRISEYFAHSKFKSIYSLELDIYYPNPTKYTGYNYIEKIMENRDIKFSEETKISNRDCVFIKLNRNIGFASGNNLGFYYLKQFYNHDYIILFNNDAYVKEDFLLTLNNIIKDDDHETKLIFQPKIYKTHNKKIIDSFGIQLNSNGSITDIGSNQFEFKKLYSDEDFDEIFGVCGAFSIISSKIINQGVIFKDNLFLTFEDVDLNFKLRLAGYKIYRCNRLVAYHKRGISGKDVESKLSINKRYFTTRNAFYIYIKYYPRFFFLRELPHVGIQFVSLLKASVMKRKLKSTFAFLISSIRERRLISSRYNDILLNIQQEWIN